MNILVCVGTTICKSSLRRNVCFFLFFFCTILLYDHFVEGILCNTFTDKKLQHSIEFLGTQQSYYISSDYFCKKYIKLLHSLPNIILNDQQAWTAGGAIGAVTLFPQSFPLLASKYLLLPAAVGEGNGRFPQL